MFCYNVNEKLPSTYLLYTICLSRSIYRSQYGDAAGLLEPEKKGDSIYKSAGYFYFYFGDTFEQGRFQTSCSCCAELNSFDRIKFDFFSTAVARRLKPSRATVVLHGSSSTWFQTSRYSCAELI